MSEAPADSSTNLLRDHAVEPVRSAASEVEVYAVDAASASDSGTTPELAVEPSGASVQPFRQNANLHNLVQIESLSRSTGVFEVRSRGRSGYLHLVQGELVHAELDGERGEAAAIEILSWAEGEVRSVERPVAEQGTIVVPLQALLLQLSAGSDEAVDSLRRPPLVRSAAPEEDKPTVPHLPAPTAEALAPASVPAPRSSRLPPPLPPRIEREPASAAEVVLSPSGELLQSRGVSADDLAARVAYAARLAELIGRAIRSGAPRGLELHGKGTHTHVKWQPDGNVAASLELAQSPKLR